MQISVEVLLGVFATLGAVIGILWRCSEKRAQAEIDRLTKETLEQKMEVSMLHRALALTLARTEKGDAEFTEQLSSILFGCNLGEKQRE